MKKVIIFGKPVTVIVKNSKRDAVKEHYLYCLYTLVILVQMSV